MTMRWGRSFAFLSILALVVAPGCGDKKDEKGKGGPQGQTGSVPMPAPKGAGGHEGSGGAPPAPVGPPVAVLLGNVAQKDVPVTLEFVGQTAGIQDVEIRARVQGFLLTMDYSEGKMVKEGDLLFTIDPKDLQTSLDAAKGKLAAAQALLERANNTVTRYTPLAKEGAISQKELDDAISSQKTAEGQVDAAKAAVDQAQINLGYARITAPVAGLAGQSQVKVGNLVGKGENTLLATVSIIDPLKVQCSITESDFLRLSRRRIEQVKAGEKVETKPFRMTLADGSKFPHEGTLLSIDRAVDKATGTLKFEVQFPNPDLLLRPGAFARLAVDAETNQGALLVPQRAVTEIQGQFFVAVVDEGMKVTMRRVKPGVKVGSEWVIDEGLKAGEMIVVDGVQKVRDGTVVAPQGAGGEAPKAPDSGK